ncbi:MAG: hypothetical protein K5882_05770 [Bacteroidales bacterium]|nr:hypothetical protein [Bacteroidales bacterium]
MRFFSFFCKNKKKEPSSSCQTTKTRTASLGPIEAERKFLVEIVGEMPECRELEISQTYLKEKDGLEPRVRKRKENGHYVYFLTTKQFVSVNERVEIEREISQAEYEALLAAANPAKRTIHKRRQCFEWDNRYLELDTFIEPPLPHHLLEIEHVSMEDIISFPPFLKVIEEVTENPDYYNSNISKRK